MSSPLSRVMNPKPLDASNLSAVQHAAQSVSQSAVRLRCLLSAGCGSADHLTVPASLGLDASVGPPALDEVALRVEASPSLKTAREVEIGLRSREEGAALLPLLLQRLLSLNAWRTGATVDNTRRRAMKDICSSSRVDAER